MRPGEFSCWKRVCNRNDRKARRSGRTDARRGVFYRDAVCRIEGISPASGPQTLDCKQVSLRVGFAFLNIVAATMTRNTAFRPRKDRKASTSCRSAPEATAIGTPFSLSSHQLDHARKTGRPLCGEFAERRRLGFHEIFEPVCRKLPACSSKACRKASRSSKPIK